MVTVTTFTEAGGHPVNEDAFLTLTHPTDHTCQLCFLADGQGGRSGGAEASKLACSVSASAASRLSPAKLSRPSSWQGILEEADQAVAKDPQAGFTTLIGFCIHAGYLTGASNGDSAVLVITGGKAVEITMSQAKNPPIGSGDARVVPFSMQMVEPWKVVAMSDGVWKYVGWERVVRTATEESGEQLVEALCRAARMLGSGGFQDDFTIVSFDSLPDDGV
jgi:serine/threonine protein phosphatase PrpC